MTPDSFASVGYQNIVSWIVVRFQHVEDIDSLAVAAIPYNQPFFDPVYWLRTVLKENRSRRGIMKWPLHLNHPRWLETDSKILLHTLLCMGVVHHPERIDVCQKISCRKFFHAVANSIHRSSSRWVLTSASYVFDNAEAANDIFDQSVPANMGSITTCFSFSIISLNMPWRKFGNASSPSTT
mmetsp:Transcript_25295/g.59234  ORF Transcript_25295/g.59234 Transcript_25295/m.59234 type:complete len:182 (-) Transcript_25295:620-1165(-)